MSDYDNYVAGKIIEATPTGFDVDASDLNPVLFPYQRDIVRWAIRRGKAALFEYPGLGKSIQEWEFAKHTSATPVCRPSSLHRWLWLNR